MNRARNAIPILLRYNPPPPVPHRLQIEPRNHHSDRTCNLHRREEPPRTQRLSPAPRPVRAGFDVRHLAHEAARVELLGVGTPDGVCVDQGAGDEEHGVLFEQVLVGEEGVLRYPA